MTERAYAETAYRGDDPVPRRREGERTIPRSEEIPYRGVECGEFVAPCDDEDHRLLTSDKPKYRWGRKLSRKARGVIWAGADNINMFVYLAHFFCFFVGFAVLISIALGAVIRPEFQMLTSSESIPFYAFGSGAILLGVLLRKLLWSGWLPLGSMLVFDRASGMLRDRTWGKVTSYPFRDFVPVINQVFVQAGGVSYRLLLVHRHEKLFFACPGTLSSARESWKVFLEWEYIQQYMDITKPIPDIPDLECLRQDDPVTRAWDAKHHRPADFWAGMSEGRFRGLQRRAARAARRFPWGADRGSVLVCRWQPSAYGEATFPACADYRKLAVK